MLGHTTTFKPQDKGRRGGGGLGERQRERGTTSTTSPFSEPPGTCLLQFFPYLLDTNHRGSNKEVSTLHAGMALIPSSLCIFVRNLPETSKASHCAGAQWHDLHTNNFQGHQALCEVRNLGFSLLKFQPKTSRQILKGLGGLGRRLGLSPIKKSL